MGDSDSGEGRKPAMKRFFFGLQGGQNTDDPHGLLYADDLRAFQAAEKLAAELSYARPNLRGNTCVVIAPRGVDDLYCVSI
jgi:hypothetical protein